MAPNTTSSPVDIIDEIFQEFDTDEVIKVQRVSRNFKREKSGIRRFEITINTDAFKIFGSKKTEINPDPIGDSSSIPTLPFVENKQLNRFHPGSIISKDSKIFETSEDLTDFLKKVQLFQMMNFIKENVASVREKKLKNFCAKMAAMKQLCLFSIQVPVPENELEKLILSLTSQRDLFIFDIHQKKPLLSKSILSAILKVSPKNTRISIKIQKPNESWPLQMFHKLFEQRIDKKDVDGVVWFLKNEENSEFGKIIFIRNCAKPIAEQILKNVQKTFVDSKPIFNPTSVEIRVGNRSLYICYE